MQQMLLAGRGLIEPTTPVGGLLFSDTDTQAYPGNGVYYTPSDNSFTIPDNWQEKNYRYEWSISSTASYTCIGYLVRVYKNGVEQASWSTQASNEGYFRYNSGTRSGNLTMSLKAGDVVRGLVQIVGRNVGGSTPSATNYHEVERIT